jgi:HEAT repeats/PQQ-like domain
MFQDSFRIFRCSCYSESGPALLFLVMRSRMFRVAFWTTLSLLAVLLFPPLRLSAEEAEKDELLLKGVGVKTDADSLLALFRKLSPTETDRKRMIALVKQLGSDGFDEREEASRLLIEWRLAALEPLRKALNESDAEIKRRAQACIEEIENGPGNELPCAAARVLARRRPAAAVTTLLQYLPNAGDSNIHEAVFSILVDLAPPPSPADPNLLAALKDSAPIRRAAAAYALGRSRDEGTRTAVAGLLADRDPQVRLRAVQGLLAGLDRKAVPALIDLVREPSGEISWAADDLLALLAGEEPPDLPFGDDDATRQKRRDGWSQWWSKNGAGVNLARLSEPPPILGITLVPEMHANKVWEADQSGKVLWQMDGLQCPIDAQVLPGGRLLVAEINGHKVTERDRSGKILWTHNVQTPIACQRLANGSTFIGTNGRLCTVTPEGKETWSYTAEKDFYIHSVQRMRNGHYAMVSMAGKVREIDAMGKEIRTLDLPIQGGWSGIESAPGGRYLVVNHSQGKVLEIDAQGKTVWEFQTNNACYATRLANGNTLVVGNNSGLHEVDRNGKIVSEMAIKTSLWRVHRR